MLAKYVQRLRSRPVRTGLATACWLFAIWLAASNLVGYLGFLGFRADLARELEREPSGRTIEAAWSFPFQESRCAVTVAVDEAEIAAGEALDMRGVFGSSGWIRRLYVTEVVAAQADSALIDRLASAFQEIRRERGLDSDEYLELMCAGIQAIPYGERTRETMLASEVLAGDRGICTDKSLLLGSLLVHEGYQTVLWVFEQQRHVALGVESDATRFQGGRYAFVETTVPSFVGQAAAEYVAAGPVVRPPAEIMLGGTRSYGSGKQVEVILAELGRAQAVASRNASYSEFTEATTQYRDIYAEYAMECWIADTTAAFILTNAHDRPGVYAIVSASRVPAGSEPQLSAL
ncbi:MAG: hypothetical protein EG823_04345 [Actinobacteria bacterium]|nr:hypothetical protein [Actinomycetota bacterium]